MRRGTRPRPTNAVITTNNTPLTKGEDEVHAKSKTPVREGRGFAISLPVLSSFGVADINIYQLQL